MTDTWDGGDRRASDVKFDKAMGDVRALKDGVGSLAEALTIKSETLHRVMVRMALLFAILFLAQIIASLVFVGRITNHIETGHERIICTINLTPEQKTALGELACK